MSELAARHERPERVVVLGCPIDPVTLQQAVSWVDSAIVADGTCQHMSINAAKLVKYQSDPVLRDAIRACEIITADGQSVVWASRLLGRPLPERVTGIDLMHASLQLARTSGYPVYLLGARESVLERARREIERLYPGITVAGAHHGYFARDEEPGIVASIAAARPAILYVALETPAKELFLARNREHMSVPFVMGVGGAFDVLAGLRRRAPAWMMRLGLEWLYRLAQDPRRLARRYVVGNSKFIWLVARELVRLRFDRTARASGEANGSM